MIVKVLDEPALEDIDLGVVLSALADPGRRAIMQVMYRGPAPFDCSASTWTADLGIGAPTLSHHFRVLRSAGLTRTMVAGRARSVEVREVDLERRFPGLLDAILGPAAASPRPPSPDST
jgi:DNA-binding transcriptional ArsR family regulator